MSTGGSEEDDDKKYDNVEDALKAAFDYIKKYPDFNRMNTGQNNIDTAMANWTLKHVGNQPVMVNELKHWFNEDGPKNGVNVRLSDGYMHKMQEALDNMEEKRLDERRSLGVKAALPKAMQDAKPKQRSHISSLLKGAESKSKEKKPKM